MKNFMGEGSQARPWDPQGLIFLTPSGEKMWVVFVTRGGGDGREAGQRRFDI